MRARRKRGRPKLKEPTRTLSFRMTDAERRECEAAADHYGHTLTAWIRWVALRAARERRE